MASAIRAGQAASRTKEVFRGCLHKILAEIDPVEGVPYTRADRGCPAFTPSRARVLVVQKTYRSSRRTGASACQVRASASRFNSVSSAFACRYLAQRRRCASAIRALPSGVLAPVDMPP